MKKKHTHKLCLLPSTVCSNRITSVHFYCYFPILLYVHIYAYICVCFCAFVLRYVCLFVFFFSLILRFWVLFIFFWSVICFSWSPVTFDEFEAYLGRGGCRRPWVCLFRYFALTSKAGFKTISMYFFCLMAGWLAGCLTACLLFDAVYFSMNCLPDWVF